MNSQKILIDSSFLYAVYSTIDKNHQTAMAFMETTENAPVVPDIILPEVAYLFLRDVGYHAVERFLYKFAEVQPNLQSLTIPDIRRAQEIMVAYPSARFDLVDCCLMSLSERLQITQICTFDRRNFSIFRPRHCECLELLP